MKIFEIIAETATAGACSSGSVAPVSAPIGKTRKRKKTEESETPEVEVRPNGVKKQ